LAQQNTVHGDCGRDLPLLNFAIGHYALLMSRGGETPIRAKLTKPSFTGGLPYIIETLFLGPDRTAFTESAIRNPQPCK
jgi:hypothetical protein